MNRQDCPLEVTQVRERWSEQERLHRLRLAEAKQRWLVQLMDRQRRSDQPKRPVDASPRELCAH